VRCIGLSGALPSGPMSHQTHQAPTGTRDFYPLDAAQRRFITESWRSASIRHGFEEIDGPTFEHAELYTVKSGEGILSELFSFTRAGGEKTYALRPEFTPTLARLYASKANSLPKPTKWFCTPTFFRAERPQRGRLREFLQWNLDIIGDASPAADAEIIASCITLFESLGFTSKDLRVKINHRQALASWFESKGIPASEHMKILTLLDHKGKMTPAEFSQKFAAFGFTPQMADVFMKGVIRVTLPEGQSTLEVLGEKIDRSQLGDTGTDEVDMTFFAEAVKPLTMELTAAGVLDWVDFDLSIVRGLAYYTGMVFEVHEASGAERAVAGGGRYDNLIELFGGPSTPAVGMGMGDVVLSLVMKDRGLMPTPEILMERAGLRPDVFVISNGSPEADLQVRSTVAGFRKAGLHARHTYKTTKNVGKLLKEAADQRARFVVIIEGPDACTLKNLESGQQQSLTLAAAITTLGNR
jgi:histidyl-tRNA synthetase